MLEIFGAWRQQIEAELQAARATLNGAQAELRAALGTAEAARAERIAIAEALERVGRTKPLATALRGRRQAREDQLRAAEGNATRQKQAVVNVQAMISDLEDAIVQLEQIVPAPQQETDQETVAAEVA